MRALRIEREHPWNERRVTQWHAQWFRRLLELCALTRAWLNELPNDEAESSRLPRLPFDFIEKNAAFPELGESHWMLKTLDQALAEDEAHSFSPAFLDSLLQNLLDDTLPEDLLARLERAVWLMQSVILSQILDYSTNSSSTRIVVSLLEQASWKQGRRCAQFSWPNLTSQKNDPAHVEDLRRLFVVLQDGLWAPYGQATHGSEYLIKRALPHELSIELRACPHQYSLVESPHVADSLCQMHFHWVRGFIYAMNPRVQIEKSTARSHCSLKWGFTT